MTWAPQRAATIAGLISIAAAILCLGIVVIGWTRRRRPAAAAAGVPATGALELTPPPIRFASVWPTAATVTFTALAAALLVRPWVGLLVGALTLGRSGGDRRGDRGVHGC
jgi:hypothetical protein